MAKDGRVLVLCIDRDDDVGVYTKIPGPIIGKKDVIKAAVELAVKRPLDTDVNSMFAAIKKAEEVKKHAEHVEVAVITGDESLGFKADKEINRQLDAVLDEFDADGIVLVTDGAEDDRALP
ncbi:MAG: DUF373 family protein, partial [Candidatus Diapherotrites archaeon]|nr:DUF373 family protein [Candidatus Diapherotrites archaeon]